MVDWLIGWLVDWLVGQLVGWFRTRGRWYNVYSCMKSLATIDADHCVVK